MDQSKLSTDETAAFGAMADAAKELLETVGADVALGIAISVIAAARTDASSHNNRLVAQAMHDAMERKASQLRQRAARRR